jgi:hypothetical protein
MAILTLTLVPTDPHFVPTSEATKKAKASLKRYYPYSDRPPQAVFEEHPRFFSARANCDRYTCPRCSKTVRDTEFEELSRDPEGWLKFVSGAEKAPDALTYSVVLPCCGVEVPIHEVHFTNRSQATAAIGRFKLSLFDVEDLLSEERLARMQTALGCSITQLAEVWA